MSKIGLMPHKDASQVIALMFQHLDDWRIRSAAAFRNAILDDENSMFAINPLLHLVVKDDAMFMKGMIRSAVAEGRMIDFGHIPNEIIKTESKRANEMFQAGELQHPYEDWLGVTSWEGGYNGYYIAPHPRFKGDILVIELYGISIPDLADSILVYDLVSINLKDGHTMVRPATMQYRDHIETEKEARDRGSNSLDPLVTMLRLMADASIPIINKPAPDKLNKRRAQQGKHPIPSHTEVDVRDYVAGFKASNATGTGSKGGHHASPVAHWRRAHYRNLASGTIVPVRSSKVNWRDAETLHRMFYKVEK